MIESTVTAYTLPGKKHTAPGLYVTAAEAGVELPLYSMVDGFAGDKNPEGKRTVNGWKNAGLDRTCTIREGFWPGAAK